MSILKQTCAHELETASWRRRDQISGEKELTGNINRVLGFLEAREAELELLVS